MRSATHRAYRRHRRLSAAFVIFVLVSFGTGTAALAMSSHSRPHAQSRSAGVDPVIASQLSVFDRAPTSTDAVPSSFGGELQQAYSSETPDLVNSRQVTADDGQSAYLVPAQSGVCVINTNESFCAPEASLPGAAVVDLCSPSLPLGQLELEWLLPDGATKVSLGMSDATTVSYPLGYNVYIARLPLNSQSPIPTTIQWKDSAGQPHSVRTPVPSGAQNAGCEHPPSAGADATPSSSSAPFPYRSQAVRGPATPISR